MTSIAWYWKYFKAFTKELNRYWKNRVPRAGSIEAWTRGCSCSILKNDLGSKHQSILSSKCKLHKGD